MIIKRPIRFFLLMTFSVGWSLQLSARLAYDAGLESLFGVLILLTTAAPASAGLLCLRFGNNQPPIENWRADIWAWRQPIIGYVFGIALFTLPWLGAHLLIEDARLAPEVLAIAPFVLLAAFFEEIGWRRFLLDRFLEQWGPARASTVLGLLWSIWHVVDYIRQPAVHFAVLFALLLVLLVSQSLIYTQLYVRFNRSVPLVTVAHAATNIMAQLVSPADIFSAELIWIRAMAALLFVLIALLIWRLPRFRLTEPSHIRN